MCVATLPSAISSKSPDSLPYHLLFQAIPLIPFWSTLPPDGIGVPS